MPLLSVIIIIDTVILYYTMPYHSVLCHTNILYCSIYFNIPYVSCSTIFYDTVFYCSRGMVEYHLLHDAVLYYIILQWMILYHTSSILHKQCTIHIILPHTVLYHTKQYILVLLLLFVGKACDLYCANPWPSQHQLLSSSPSWHETGMLGIHT